VAGVRIDLHTHSNVSDGTEPPAELVAAADRSGLDVVALTDHDTFDGWTEATTAAERYDIVLVLGVEMSCRLATAEGVAGVHLLGYLPDPTDADLLAELAEIRAGRAGRVPMMVDRLRRHGVEISVDDITARVTGAAPGRPHVADALVAGGYATDRRDAFDRWLAEGRPGYVTRYAPDPARAIQLIRVAGGAPVLAHPRGRASRTLVTDQVVADLAAVGLAGLEVDHLDHDPRTRADLRRLAGELDLIVTGASDYHGVGKVGHHLGCETTDPEQFERLLASVRTNAAATGRTISES
jgi:3',5'-nucleoside bisphosphate phosphatase